MIFRQLIRRQTHTHTHRNRFQFHTHTEINIPFTQWTPTAHTVTCKTLYVCHVPQNSTHERSTLASSFWVFIWKCRTGNCLGLSCEVRIHIQLYVMAKSMFCPPFPSLTSFTTFEPNIFSTTQARSQHVCLLKTSPYHASLPFAEHTP